MFLAMRGGRRKMEDDLSALPYIPTPWLLHAVGGLLILMGAGFFIIVGISGQEPDDYFQPLLQVFGVCAAVLTFVGGLLIFFTYWYQRNKRR